MWSISVQRDEMKLGQKKVESKNPGRIARRDFLTEKVRRRDLGRKDDV